MELLEDMVRTGRARTITSPYYFHSTLGPTLRADPRVQSALLELGGLPFEE